MTTYTANGAGHLILTKLAAGPCYCDALQSLMPIKSLNRTLIALSADGMIELSGAGYGITTAGAELKASLDAGRVMTVGQAA